MEAALCKGAVSYCTEPLLALFGPVRPPQGGKKKGEPMKKKTILFDLDGTLLPMDQDAFTRGYFKLLAQKLAPHGYDPAALVDNIWAGTAAMVGNDGKRTNEAAFWDRFAACMGSRSGRTSPCLTPFTGRSFSRPRLSAALPQKPGPQWRPARPPAIGWPWPQSHLSGGGHGEPHPLGGAGPGDLCMVHHL